MNLVMGEDLPENKEAFERALDRAFGAPRVVPVVPVEPQWRPSDGADICPACFTLKIASVCRRCCP